MLDALSDEQRFALSALLEVTPPATVGEFVGETDEGDYVVTYRFATTLPGYPGWNWTIAIAHLPEEEPTVVESELLPADGALLAPDWIPWSDRMDDYRAAQLALGESASDSEEDDDDDDEDDEDLFGSDNLHGGDLDGVDIDEIDDDTDEADGLDDELTPEAEIVEDYVEGLGTPELQVDEGNEPESKGDSGSENPPRVPRRRKRASKEQQDDQGD
ncbi:MAG: hypothetical protein QOH69_737 [Actinomycetota bacterium]|jgi:hypothetical protein|nr:hypothetical protein [Actinomycetota bacterium]